MNVKCFNSILLSSLITYHLSLITSCSSIECPVQNVVTLQCEVVDATGNVMSLSTDTLWVFTRRNDGKDTLLLNRFSASSFSLPVSYSNPEDTMLLLVNSKDKVLTLDTLFLKKDDIPHFESVDCPAHFFHRITGVRTTHYRLDSVTIANPNVNYDQSYTHLRLYYGGIFAGQ